MFKKLTNASVSLVNKYLPNAFVFAIVLTFVTLLGGIFITGQSLTEMIIHWGDGFWGLLTFTLQMTLVLVLGNALASAKVVKRLLTRIASLATSPGQAIVLVTVVSSIAIWINWGFGLIVGALLSREIVKFVKNVDYRLLIASAYSVIVIWHAGFSGSIPLTLATDAAANAAATAGALTTTIPVSETIFALPNLLIMLAVMIALPFVNRAMHPDPENTITIDPALLEEEEEVIVVDKTNITPGEKLENSRVLSMAVVVLSGFYIVNHFITNGLDLNLNIVNLIFLTLGILLHGTPIEYVNAINEGIKGAGGIILQFPFYAGIMGMMVGTGDAGVSLAGVISTGILSVSTKETMPMLSFWASGLVNIFVPSGGGQWAVQAPIMMPAGAELGVNPAITGMAISWGDAWTNTLQPFWALPALAIAKLEAKDIMGFCVMVLLISGAIISLGFLAWGIMG